MARRARRTSSRSYGRTSRSSRSSYARPARSYRTARKASARSTRRAVSRGREIRIVIEQPGANPLARPELIGKMPIVGLTRNRSRF